MNTCQKSQLNCEQEGLNEVQCKLIVLRLDELHPHPSYVRHRLSVSASQLSTLSTVNDLAFRYPIVITQDHTIIDGYARRELAKRKDRATILCIQYQMTDEEALETLIRHHCRLSGLNNFCRILLALDLEPGLAEAARANQQLGGQIKGSSNLTEAQRRDVRQQIAKTAGVSVGNVTKAKEIIAKAVAKLIEALKNGEIRTHRAWLWCKLTPEEQREELRLYRLNRGLKQPVKSLAIKHRINSPPGVYPLSTSTFGLLRQRVSSLLSSEFDRSEALAFGVVKSPGRAIFLTTELYEALLTEGSTT